MKRANINLDGIVSTMLVFAAISLAIILPIKYMGQVTIMDLNETNMSPVINQIPTIIFEEDGYNDSIKLKTYVTDNDTNLSDLRTEFTTDNIKITITDNTTLSLNITAAANWNGIENVNLTIRDPEGHETNSSFLVNVSPVYDGFDFNITNPKNNAIFNLYETINFTSSLYNPDNANITYLWNLSKITATTLNTTYSFDKEGNLTISLTLNDSITKLTKYINITVEDQIPPKIIQIKYRSLVYTNESQTITVNFTDHNDIDEAKIYIEGKTQLPSFGSNKTYTWVISPLSMGEKKFFVIAKDVKNNSFTSDEYNFTVFRCIERWECDEWSSCQEGIKYKIRHCEEQHHCGTDQDKPSEVSYCPGYSPPDNTAGSGNLGTKPSEYAVTYLILKINKGNYYEINIKRENIPITGIKITAKEEITNLNLEVKALTNKPEHIDSAPNKVYKYLEISKDRNVNITNNEIKFKVEKTWLTSNNISKNSVRLMHYTDSWNELNTILSREDSHYAHYTAFTPSFSYFAITGNATFQKTLAPKKTIVEIQAPASVKTQDIPEETKKVLETFSQTDNKTSTKDIKKDLTGSSILEFPESILKLDKKSIGWLAVGFVALINIIIITSYVILHRYHQNLELNARNKFDAKLVQFRTENIKERHEPKLKFEKATNALKNYTTSLSSGIIKNFNAFLSFSKDAYGNLKKNFEDYKFKIDRIGKYKEIQQQQNYILQIKLKHKKKAREIYFNKKAEQREKETLKKLRKGIYMQERIRKEHLNEQREEIEKAKIIKKKEERSLKKIKPVKTVPKDKFSFRNLKIKIKTNEKELNDISNRLNDLKKKLGKI
ncbi:hypothetical protein DRJ17_00190 [Candidatus Woesearchaeota archaeon]|nr:MAG: hypothetical protein DRJ17_00190 [Candidatus Woesearchaeota archaeon]